MLHATRGTIIIETYEDLKNSFEVMCKCGHKASSHGFYIYGYGVSLPAQANVSQCCLCGNGGTHLVDGELEFVCKIFDPEEKICQYP